MGKQGYTAFRRHTYTKKKKKIHVNNTCLDKIKSMVTVASFFGDQGYLVSF